MRKWKKFNERRTLRGIHLGSLVCPSSYDLGENLRLVAERPGMKIFELSAKSGEGMAEYLEFLERRGIRSRAAAAI
jgi:hypothetical protein